MELIVLEGADVGVCGLVLRTFSKRKLESSGKTTNLEWAILTCHMSIPWFASGECSAIALSSLVLDMSTRIAKKHICNVQKQVHLEPRISPQNLKWEITKLQIDRLYSVFTKTEPFPR